MAFILPYGSTLRFGRIPWVSLALIALCIVIFIGQSYSRDEVWKTAFLFCGENQEKVSDLLIRLKEEKTKYPVNACSDLLRSLHESPNKEWVIGNIDKWMIEEKHAGTEERLLLESTIRTLYDEFQARAPRSWDALLLTDPLFPNPLRMLTSSFSHADLWHLLGNLFFFLAFGPALELIITRRIRFLGIVLISALTSSLAQFLFDHLFGHPAPSLGFSGVVMAMIGLGAYLMPHAHIRTLVWLFFYVGRWHIPAWILAVWYVGWDLYDLTRIDGNPGIAFAAHVGGAMTGYLLGRWWLSERKAEVQEELAEETADQAALRNRWWSQTPTHYRQRARIESEERVRLRRLAYDRLLDRLHNRARTGRSSEALALLLDELDSLGDSVPTWTQLFETIQTWGQTRFLFCVSRIAIQRLVEVNRCSEALSIAEKMICLNEAFVLSDPSHLPALAQAALETNRHQLAYQLVRDSDVRYPHWNSVITARLIEVRILIDHFAELGKAREIVNTLLSDVRYIDNRRLHSLAAFLNE